MYTMLWVWINSGGVKVPGDNLFWNMYKIKTRPYSVNKADAGIVVFLSNISEINNIMYEWG